MIDRTELRRAYRPEENKLVEQRLGEAALSKAQASEAAAMARSLSKAVRGHKPAGIDAIAAASDAWLWFSAASFSRCSTSAFSSGRYARRNSVRSIMSGAAYASAPWQCLYFWPDPHGHGELRLSGSTAPSGIGGNAACCRGANIADAPSWS